MMMVPKLFKPIGAQGIRTENRNGHQHLTAKDNAEQMFYTNIGMKTPENRGYLNLVATRILASAYRIL
jgi:hypothetical protein